MVRDLLIVIMSYMAKMERQRISERTKAGLARTTKRRPRMGKERRRVLQEGVIQAQYESR